MMGETYAEQRLRRRIEARRDVRWIVYSLSQIVAFALGLVGALKGNPFFFLLALCGVLGCGISGLRWYWRWKDSR